MTKTAAISALLAALLAPIVASAQNTVAARVGPGVQMTCAAAAPDHVSTRGALWCKSTDSNKLHYVDPSGSDAAVGGSSLTFPLTNGSSTVSFNSGVANGGAAVAYSRDTTNALTTDGAVLDRWRSNGTDWLTLTRASSARKLTLFGDADGTGSGPLEVKSSSSSAGILLDATGAGGRKYSLSSAASGIIVLADLTAGANRWQMDANGALAPFSHNTVNLGLPGTNEMAAVYSVLGVYSGALSASQLTSGSGGAGTVFAATFNPNTASTAVSLGTNSNTSSVAIGRSAITTTITGTAQVTGNITNDADSTRDIATSGSRYNNIFVKTVSAGAAGLTLTGASTSYVLNASGFDIGSATGFALGGINSTSVTVGRSGNNTTIAGALRVAQGFAANYRTAATTVTVAVTDRFVGVTGTGARTVNLPAANTCTQAGQEIVIQEVGGDVGTITINRASTDTINGATSITIAAAYGRKTLFCNASNAWFASSATN